MQTDAENNERYKILLIEDDEIDQMAFTSWCKTHKMPYDYTIVSSVAQTEIALHENDFDVVLVDYMLDDGDAFDIFELFDDTPKICTTGAGDEAIAIKAMKAGAYDYIVKDKNRNYLKLLPGVIKNAVNHKKNEDRLKLYHQSLEMLVKERTDQLAKEKELISITLSSMSDAVIAVDTKKRIIVFNKVAERLTRYDFSQASEKSIDEVFKVIDEKTRQSIKGFIDDVFETGSLYIGSGKDCLLAKDGTEYPVAISASPIRQKNGSIIGIVIVFRDVSREREIDRMKNDFISSITHELRTPLTSIRAYTETLLNEQDLTEDIKRDFLMVVDDESKRLAVLIDDILEISKIESGKVQINIVPIKISALIDQVVIALKSIADKKDVILKTDIHDSSLIMLADEGKINSLVTNLLSNAVKFTPAGGTVEISLEKKNEQVVLTFSDTGLGIPKNDLCNIFDRFYRVPRDGENIQGTGIGLAIVKEIITMHNGTIDVHSEVGKGSKFIVTLPLKTQRVNSPAKVN